MLIISIYDVLSCQLHDFDFKCISIAVIELSILILSCDEMFCLRHDFVSCVTAGHAPPGDNMTLAGGKLMAAIIDLE